jgi:hypothetical protein
MYRDQLMPPNDDECLVNQISVVLGEASDFDSEYGYYAEGVTSKTPTFAPRDWKSSAIPVEVAEYIGRCMEAHDLVLSKLGAGREKDLEFARSTAKLKLVNRETLLNRLQDVDCADPHRELMARRINALC